MKNDNYGIANDPRPDQQPETDRNEKGISKTNGQGNPTSANRRRGNERSGEIERVEETITGPNSEEIQKYLEETILIHNSSWSGLLPDPDSFLKYPESVQESIVSWTNAQILDESKRQDKLVEATIKQIPRESTLSFVLNAGFAIISLIAFLVTKDPASFGFLAVPGISVVFNGVKFIRAEKSKSQEEPDNEQSPPG